MSVPRGVLLDIDGTLTDGLGGPALPGAVDAVKRLAARVPVRYVTNTTSRTRDRLDIDLTDAGFTVDPGSIVTPTILARKVLQARGEAEGILLAEPSSLPDLGWFRPTPEESARAVLVATEAHGMRIGDLGPAVRALLRGARLYTLQQNRYFQRAALVTDLGPVTAFLGYAANVTWENFGKPSRLLFEALASELGCAMSELAMVGDDAEFDASGALVAGVGQGVLVRTGKYRPGDETRVTPPPTLVCGSIAEVPAALGLL
jgi:HAD superfamily hydrolase (TIGR01458 family)